LIVIIFIGIALGYSIIYLMAALGISKVLVDWINSPNNLLLYMTTIGGDPLLAKYGRLTDLRVTVVLLERNAQSLLFGFGPGLLARTAQSYVVSSPFFMYLQKGIGGIQVTSILLEVGFLGEITYLFLPLIVAAGIMRAPRLGLDPAMVLQISSYMVVTVLYLVGLFYSQPWWSAALSVSYWTYAGMTWTNARKSDIKHEGTL
jgi:hypothetical protein